MLTSNYITHSGYELDVHVMVKAPRWRLQTLLPVYNSPMAARLTDREEYGNFLPSRIGVNLLHASKQKYYLQHLAEQCNFK